MRITVNQLRRIIKEETRRVLSEGNKTLSMRGDTIVDNEGNEYYVSGEEGNNIVLRRENVSSQDYGGGVDSLVIKVDIGTEKAVEVDEDPHGASGYGAMGGSPVSVDEEVMEFIFSV